MNDDDLAAAHRALEDARNVAKLAGLRVEECEQQFKKLRRELNEARDNFAKAKDNFKRAKHLADGFCAQMIRAGSDWHIYYEPCSKKAKTDGLCGTHYNVKQRREAR